MKNKSRLKYINFTILAFSILAMVFSFLNTDTFKILVFILSLISILLISLSLILLKKLDKEFETLSSQTIVKKQDTSNDLIGTDNEEDEENTCLELMKSIDQTLPIHELLDLKIKKVADLIQLVGGLIYIRTKDVLELKVSYAFIDQKQEKTIKIGEGLTGQVSLSGEPIEIDLRDHIEIEIISGLGKSKPNFLYILPLLNQEKIIGVIELATFIKLEKKRINFLIEAFSQNDKK